MKFKKGNRWKSSKQNVRYKSWRRSVFLLNKGRHGANRNYVCVKCSKRRKTTRVLHAHHIFSWKKFPEKRYDRNNGVVLCKYCHNGFHYKYKFEALDRPELLLNYITSKRQKHIKEYIDVQTKT
jgi:5-methylcytosine-specific restriction endonuclease McrA